MVYSLYIGLNQEFFVEETVQKELRDVREQHRMTEAIATAQAEGDLPAPEAT